MNDRFGVKVDLGDDVVYARSSGSSRVGIAKGVVTGFTKTMVKCKLARFDNNNPKHNLHSHNCKASNLVVVRDHYYKEDQV